MPPQPFESRLDSLERHVTQLEQLPARIDALTSQVSHLRTEMRGEFSAVRTEMAEQGATIIATLRGEMAEQGASLATRMLVLHEEVISRIAPLQEGWPRPPKPRRRKK
jgi:hypothetical protein